MLALATAGKHCGPHTAALLSSPLKAPGVSTVKPPLTGRPPLVLHLLPGTRRR